MLNTIIVVYAIIDDLLKALGHHEDIRCQMSDAEIITTARSCSDVFQWESQSSL